jgi:HEPN domain-containing protein
LNKKQLWHIDYEFMINSNVDMKNLQTKLMFDQAKDILFDANILKQSFATKSDSAYLMTLLSFELFIKCLLQIQFGKIFKTHDYKELFHKLPDNIQQEIIDFAELQMTTMANFSNLDLLLDTWSSNFIKLRYPYESYKGLSEQEYNNLGEKWLKNGAKNEDATFDYFPNELRGLIYALQHTIKEKLIN